jgi:hypothetical protein
MEKDHFDYSMIDAMLRRGNLFLDDRSYEKQVNYIQGFTIKEVDGINTNIRQFEGQ